MKQSPLARTAHDPFLQRTPMLHEATFYVLGVPFTSSQTATGSCA